MLAALILLVSIFDASTAATTAEEVKSVPPISSGSHDVKDCTQRHDLFNPVMMLRLITALLYAFVSSSQIVNISFLVDFTVVIVRVLRSCLEHSLNGPKNTHVQGLQYVRSV